MAIDLRPSDLMAAPANVVLVDPRLALGRIPRRHARSVPADGAGVLQKDRKNSVTAVLPSTIGLTAARAEVPLAGGEYRLGR